MTDAPDLDPDPPPADPPRGIAPNPSHRVFVAPAAGAWEDPNSRTVDRPSVRQVAIESAVIFLILKVVLTAASDVIAAGAAFHIGPQLYIGTLAVAVVFGIQARVIGWHLNEAVIVRATGRVRSSIAGEAALAGLMNSLPVVVALLWQYELAHMITLTTHAGAFLLSWALATAWVAARLNALGAWRPMTAWTIVFVAIELGLAAAFDR